MTEGKAVKLPMEVKDIEKCIPHRYPFLLVDRIIEFEHLQHITGIKCISMTDPILQGHFPENPVMPGVLIVEGIAQTAGVLGHLSLQDGFQNCLLTEISNTRFRRPVVPGDVLHYNIKVVKVRQPFFWFEAEATVDGELAAKVSLSALIK